MFANIIHSKTENFQKMKFVDKLNDCNTKILRLTLAHTFVFIDYQKV